MKAKKFVINDGFLILGQVEFHEDLVKNMDRSKTIGGGRWHFDEDDNTIYFYGDSTDFGSVTKEQFDAAFKQPSLSRVNIVFSDKMFLSDVMKEINEKKCNNS